MIRKLISHFSQKKNTSTLSPDIQRIMDQVKLDQDEISPVFKIDSNMPESANPNKATDLDIGA